MKVNSEERFETIQEYEILVIVYNELLERLAIAEKNYRAAPASLIAQESLIMARKRFAEISNALKECGTVEEIKND